jgi:hypothetical protein
LISPAAGDKKDCSASTNQIKAINPVQTIPQNHPFDFVLFNRLISSLLCALIGAFSCFAE